jgi:hypothetical protein
VKVAENYDAHAMVIDVFDLRRSHRGDHREHLLAPNETRCDSGEIAERRGSVIALMMKGEP